MSSIIPIRAFRDNYIWLIHDGKHAIVVDPGESTSTVAYLEQHGLRLVGILLTHGHADHVDGVVSLLKYQTSPVFSADCHVTRPNTVGVSWQIVEDGQTIKFPALGLHFLVMHTPGHVAHHLVFYEPTLSALFCGDTLFGAGCGRVFEGTAEELWQSLRRLNALPAETKIYCAHEYTLANLLFAHLVEPDNEDILQRQQRDEAKLGALSPTLPSTLALERATNPFLRCTQPQVIAAVSRHVGVVLTEERQIFAALRSWKDHFKA